MSPLVPIHHDERVTLHHGDAIEMMSVMGDDCIDSIVTSPEYADQRRYRHGAKTRPAEYASKFAPALEQMLRVLRPGGSLMLNLGVIMRGGEESPYADEVLATARAMGWKLLHRMVWHKSNPLPLSHPEYLTVGHEWVFWLAPTTKVYRGYDADTRTPHSPHSIRRSKDAYLRSKDDERYTRRGKSNPLHPDGARPTTVFTCAVGSTRGINHPAPMPMRLAQHLVSLSTPVGGTVMDPFLGSGTTALAAISRGRRCLGIELNREYLDETLRRLGSGEF